MSTMMQKPTDVVPVSGIPTSVSDVTTPPIAVEVPHHYSSHEMRTKKLVNVTVTVLDIAGLLVKDGKKKKKGLMSKKFMSSSGSSSNGSSAGSPSRKGKGDENGAVGDNSTQGESSKTNSTSSSSTEPPTTIVASFSRVVKTREGKCKTVMTHVPSMPLPLSDDAATAGVASGGKDGASKKKRVLNSVIRWPEQSDAKLGHDSSGRVLSSYQFQQTFQPEDTQTNPSAAAAAAAHSSRFVPQPLSIQIAISRSGRMFKLGTTSILLSGEENGESSINVPIANCNPAIPKGGKKLGPNSNSPTSNAGNTAKKDIPMMKLKGDTIKCGLDPSATLRVQVHVSEPIGETMELSPKFNVTMISNSMNSRMSLLAKQKKDKEEAEKLKLQKEMKQLEEMKPAKRELEQDDIAQSSTGGGIQNAISYDYDPKLAAIVVKSQMDRETATIDDDAAYGDAPLTPRQAPQEDRQVPHDEPSCTSSAYMSSVDHGYPTKQESSIARSYSTATTDVSSVVSDLTDGHSWLSQAGIEVIPFAAMSNTKLPASDDIALTPDSRLRDVDEDAESISTASEADSRTTGMTLGRASTATPFVQAKPPAATTVKQTWRQRLSCSFPAVCGSSYNGTNDALSSVNEDDVISTNKYSLVGRGCEVMDFHNQTSMSYYTEEEGDVKSFVYDDDNDDWRESSLGSM